MMAAANGGGAGNRHVRAIAATALVAAIAGCGSGGGGTSYPATASAGPETGAVPGDGAGARPGVVAGNGGAEDLVGIDTAPVGGVPMVPTRPVAPRPGPPGPSPGSSTPQPGALGQFLNDPSRLEPLPEPAEVHVAASGLEIVYTTQAQRDGVEPAYIEAQWAHMQDCTGVVAPLPAVVLIVEGEARPITASDDVVRAIDGLALSTASVGAAGTTLQVSGMDLLADSPDRGFALRAITGRWLWQGASRPERDYPFACAARGPVGP